MAETKSVPKWLPYAGYPAFFLAAVVLFAHLTLPYGAIEAKLTDQARANGYQLSMVSFGPSLLFGATAKGVKLSVLKPTASAGADAAAPDDALYLDSVRVRPGLFPPGLHFSVAAFGGSLDGYVANRGKDGISLSAQGSAELARAALKPLLGVDMQGKVNLAADLSVNTKDFAKTTGTVKLTGKDVVLNGGTVKYIDLPKASLGSVNLKVKAEKGKATLDAFEISGGDIEAKGSGDVALSSRWNASTLQTSFDFKPADAWLKKNSFIQTGLAMAGHANSEGFYTATVNGLLLNPRANLKR